MALFVGAVVGLSACSKEEDNLMQAKRSLPMATEMQTKANHSGVNQMVAQLKQATTQYHNSQTALNDGFFNTQDCIELPGVGGMGVHFVRFDRVDSIHNPLEPEVLVYEIKKNGSYKLVAVEYLHIGSTPPMFAGQVAFHPFPGPQADYALHVWAWKANPSGIFEDWNPNVSCP